MLGCDVPPPRVSGAKDSCQSAAQSTRDADHSVALRNQWAKLHQESGPSLTLNSFTIIEVYR